MKPRRSRVSDKPFMSLAARHYQPYTSIYAFIFPCNPPRLSDLARDEFENFGRRFANVLHVFGDTRPELTMLGFSRGTLGNHFVLSLLRER